MLISIIAPIYKVEAYIERFIRSIVDQTCLEFELILVNDFTPDNSVTIAENLLQQYPHIQYRVVNRKQNGGLSAARNSGIEVASGEYLYFADSDDELELSAIENMKSAIKEYSNASIFFFNATFKNPSDTKFHHWRSAGEIPKLLSSVDYLTLLYSGKIGAYIWQFLFRKEVFEKNRFKEGAVWEDCIIVPQLVTYSDGVVSLDQYFIYKYWLREGSISKSVHPFLDEVIPALNEVQIQLYPNGNENLYPLFVKYRTALTMTLSRECFTRTSNYKRLMQIHRTWGQSIPFDNISSLWKNKRRKSAFFICLIKYFPTSLYLLYRFKVLR